MQKSTIRLLPINFLLVFLLVSCGVNPIRKLEKVPVAKATFEAPYFSDPKIDYVYKTHISVYGNDLSGIFVVKKINSDWHRVVFTTEFGNKLLDFEISETDFKINSIVEELDRKILINTLKEDFRLLLKKKFAIQNQFATVSDAIYESEDGKYYDYLFVSKSGRQLHKIEHTSKRKEKFSIHFQSENNIFAEHISIEHQNIKLKIELNYLKNE
ncbi:hypothetical protein [Flavobacterium noncentrifugens]|uniref:Lipoprotein n=1 Tax=Flavobacterium noncentrifugens TaxID=1128970 RepID=A0A1G8SCF0_9FLAO|nr:hypothetical protein [Flavobacterium noncentrifugens]SDJ26898.1 hypothetical protein SAMN04487935_0499 [Flavobacterium noncentrifugens]